MVVPYESGNEVLDCRFRAILWHNWELYRDDRLVAALKSKRFFTLLFEGWFDGESIEIRKNLWSEAKVSYTKSGSCIGVINSVDYLPTRFTLAGGRVYVVSNPAYGSRYVFADEHSRKLAITEFDNRRSLSVSAEFRILVLRQDDPSPWLIAIISLYLAIANSYSNP